jgi:hypothetical protein
MRGGSNLSEVRRTGCASAPPPIRLFPNIHACQFYNVQGTCQAVYRDSPHPLNASEREKQVALYRATEKLKTLSFRAKRRISLGLFSDTQIEERFFAALRMTKQVIFSAGCWCTNVQMVPREKIEPDKSASRCIEQHSASGKLRSGKY